jgi:drug/metabolite transporter (DMT)-like permease
LAILFLGEQVSFPVIVGTFLIVAGITLISWQPETQKLSFRWWHRLPLGRGLFGWGQSSAAALCVESGE